jgi:hypothetical protein
MQQELEEEISRRGLSVRLNWFGPYPYSAVLTNDVGKKPGFYIAFTPRDGKIQKVGRTSRSFAERFDDAKAKPRYQNWHFHLAPYNSGIEEAIEHAIARALMRAGEAMPEHGQPRDILHPLATIKIVKPLPPRLLPKLLGAYTMPSREHATASRDKRGAFLAPEAYPKGPKNPSVLQLDPNQLWEFDPGNL